MIGYHHARGSRSGGLKAAADYPRPRGTQPHPRPPPHHPVRESRVGPCGPPAPHQQGNGNRRQRARSERRHGTPGHPSAPSGAPARKALWDQHDALLAEERKLSAAERRLQAKVEEFGVRKEAIKAAYTAARARAIISEAVAGITGEVTDADLAASRAEDQAAGLEARAALLDGLLTPDAETLSDEQLTSRPRGDLWHVSRSEVRADRLDELGD